METQRNSDIHAAIVTGGDSAACFAEAMRRARALVCENARDSLACGACRHCLKSEKGLHPDVIVVAAEDGKSEIKVDAVRAARAEAFVMPNEAAVKVFVFRDAGQMNPSAQNALLKVLEEPPSYAAFLLAEPEPEKLLVTVRSRCWQLRAAARGDETPPDTAAGERLMALLEGENELSLAELCVSLEKAGKQGIISFLDSAAAALANALRENTDSIQTTNRIAALELVRELREMADFNVGAGHIAGKLLAEGAAIFRNEE